MNISNSFIVLFLYQKQIAKIDESIFPSLLECGKVNFYHPESYCIDERVEFEDTPTQLSQTSRENRPQESACAVKSDSTRGYASLIFKNYINNRKRLQSFDIHDLYLRLVKLFCIHQMKVINKALQHVHTEVHSLDRRIADRLLSHLEHFKVCHDQTLTTICNFYADLESINDRDLVLIAISFGLLNFHPTTKFESRLTPTLFNQYLVDESVEVKDKYRCIWYCILKGVFSNQPLM